MSTLTIRYDSDGTFHKTGGPTGATVGSNGNIDLSGVAEDNVAISWTLNDGKVFRDTNGVTISGNGNGQVFSGNSLSADKKTYTVTDANATGAADKSFTYVMHEKVGEVDPTIRNRN